MIWLIKRLSKFSIIFLMILMTVMLEITLSANPMNREDGDCIPPPIPQTDGIESEDDLGTSCRFHAGYSEVDIVIVIDATGSGDEAYVKNVSRLLTTNLALTDASYGPSNNNFLIMAVASKAEVKKNFNEIGSLDDLQAQFQLISNWKNEMDGNQMNLTDAFSQLDSLFDWKNSNRGKIIFVISNVLNSFTQSDIDAANAIKKKGVKIFAMEYAIQQQDISYNNIQLPQISSHGWYDIFLLDHPFDMYMYADFFESIRQASCICPPGTEQFFTYVYPYTYDGHERIHFYADCIFQNQTVDYRAPVDFDGALDSCRKNPSLDTREVALTSSEKMGFVQFMLGKYNVGKEFWSGWDVTGWTTYFGQQNVGHGHAEQLLKQLINPFICQRDLNLGPQNSSIGYAALYPYKDSYVPCFSPNYAPHYPFCEIRAYDTYDNPKLCRPTSY